MVKFVVFKMFGVFVIFWLILFFLVGVLIMMVLDYLNGIWIVVILFVIVVLLVVGWFSLCKCVWEVVVEYRNMLVKESGVKIV